MSQYKLVRFNLNGKNVEKMVDVRASLTDMLRNDYHMTSVKRAARSASAARATSSSTARRSIPVSILPSGQTVSTSAHSRV